MLLPTNVFFFFFNDTATTEIYTLSLHDALPISIRPDRRNLRRLPLIRQAPNPVKRPDGSRRADLSFFGGCACSTQSLSPSGAWLGVGDRWEVQTSPDF